MPVTHCTLVTEWNVICVFMCRDQRLQLAPTGRAVLPRGTENDAYVKWPGSRAQEGQAHSFSTAAKKGITAEGGGRHEQGREKLGVQMSTP